MNPGYQPIKTDDRTPNPPPRFPGGLKDPNRKKWDELDVLKKILFELRKIHDLLVKDKDVYNATLEADKKWQTSKSDQTKFS